MLVFFLSSLRSIFFLSSLEKSSHLGSLGSLTSLYSNWSNLNRTDQFFDKDIPTASSMCGQSVSWLVEDLVPFKAGPGDFFAAFEPVHFSVLEGDRMDGNTTRFDAATANFTTEKALCKVDESGTEMVVTST